MASYNSNLIFETSLNVVLNIVINAWICFKLLEGKPPMNINFSPEGAIVDMGLTVIILVTLVFWIVGTLTSKKVKADKLPRPLGLPPMIGIVSKLSKTTLLAAFQFSLITLVLYVIAQILFGLFVPALEIFDYAIAKGIVCGIIAAPATIAAYAYAQLRYPPITVA